MNKIQDIKIYEGKIIIFPTNSPNSRDERWRRLYKNKGWEGHGEWREIDSVPHVYGQSPERLTSRPQSHRHHCSNSVTCHGSIIIIANNKPTRRGHGNRNISIELNGLISKDHRQQGMNRIVKDVIPHPLSTWNYLSLPKLKPKPRERVRETKWT